MKTKDLELKLVDLQTKVDKMNLLYSIDFNPVIEKSKRSGKIKISGVKLIII